MSSHCQVTIPLPRIDNEGNGFPRPLITWFEERLRRITGGFQVIPQVQGEWRDPCGTVYREPLRIYMAMLESQRLEEVKAFLREASRVFRQQAICLGVCPVQMIFIGHPRTMNGGGNPPHGSTTELDAQAS